MVMSRSPDLLLALLTASACLGAGCRSMEAEAPVPVPDAAEDPPAGGGRLRIVGAPRSIAGAIQDVVAPFERDYASSPKRSYVDDAAYEVELLARARGFPNARVEYRIEEPGRAVIEITAGSQATIGDVRVEIAEGETSPIPAEDLVKYVNGPSTGLFGGGPMLYVERRIERAPGRIRDDLVALGHLDAKAELLEGGDPPARGGAVNVTVRVAPGPRYAVSEIRFRFARTAAPVPGEVEERIEAAVERLRKEAEGGYRPRLAGTLRGAVADALGSSGYPDAEVTVEPTVDRGARAVALALEADPGPYVVLRDVEIEGETRTRASFLRSRMRIEQGDVYDAKKLRSSLRELYRTGLFSQVTARLEGDGNVRSVVVDLEERPAIELFAEPGFGSYELARLTLGARDRNLFGRGIGASAEATVAVRALRANVGLTDPWLFKRDLIGDLRVEFDQREEPSFVRQSRGIGAFVTKEWSRSTATTFGYRFRRSEARDIEAVDADVLEVQSNVNVSGLIATQRYDVRDALFAPTRGLFGEVSLEVAADALGSELEFARGSATGAWFTPLSKGDVLGVGLRTGVIVPTFDETTIPLQERFFAGGENSVRSFLESRLGPRDADGSPLGGEAFGVLSVEWRRQLAGAFQSAAFVDAGFVEADAGDVFELDDVRLGVGVGLRYLLPIGPLRVDAAFNPDRRDGEDEWVVHFGIGMPF